MINYEDRLELSTQIDAAVVPRYQRLRQQQKRRGKKKRSRTNNQDMRHTRQVHIQRTLPSNFAVEVATMKRIKELARRAPCNVVAAHTLLQDPLSSKSSETRLMALLVMNELFQRSKHFRRAAAQEMKLYVSNTIGGIAGADLPPPQDAAQVLRCKAIAFFELWHEEYGSHFQSLRVAHQYMTTSLKIVFPKRAQTAAAQEQEQRAAAERASMLTRSLLHRDRVMTELAAGVLMEVQDHATILENCLRMLVPGSGSGSGDHNVLELHEYEQQHAAKQWQQEEQQKEEEQQREKAQRKIVAVSKDDDEEEEEEEDEWIDTTEVATSADEQRSTKRRRVNVDEDDGSDSMVSESEDEEDYEGESWSLYDNTSIAAMHCLGITSGKFELKIRVSSIKAKIMEQTANHRQYMEPTLRDCITLTNTRYMPLLLECIQVLQTFVRLAMNKEYKEKVQKALESLRELERLRDLVHGRTIKATELLGVGRAPEENDEGAEGGARRRKEKKQKKEKKKKKQQKK